MIVEAFCCSSINEVGLVFMIEVHGNAPFKVAEPVDVCTSSTTTE